MGDFVKLVGLTFPQEEEQFVLALAKLMISVAIPVFLALLYMPAPYGKYADTASILYGPKMPGRIAWILQELPSLCIPVYYWIHAAFFDDDYAVRQFYQSWNVPTTLLGCLILHYTNRAIIFPLRIRGGKPTPVVVFLMAFVFCCWNGYIQGRWLTKYAKYDDNEMWEPHFVLGFVAFALGMLFNIQADSILMNLRKPGETGYKIPHGGMFEFVSGANFFGEILEWTGWAIMAWALPQAAFAIFTFCNIAPRGAQHHEFYKQKFKDYPRTRKAVIPFLW